MSTMLFKQGGWCYPLSPPSDGAGSGVSICCGNRNPELNATQKWWAAFMGDRAFARARAAGKNETEAGHARAKAEADITLSLPAEYRD